VGTFLVRIVSAPVRCFWRIVMQTLSGVHVFQQVFTGTFPRTFLHALVSFSSAGFVLGKYVDKTERP
jgi:hypothetical protein